MKIFLASLLFSVGAFANEPVTDINCSISRYGKPNQVLFKDISIPDSQSNEKGLWKNFDVGNNKHLDIACGAVMDDQSWLRCTFASGNAGVALPVVAGAWHSGIVHLDLDDLFVQCSSVSVYQNANPPAKKPVALRSLTSAELNFCSGLQNFGSMTLTDWRAVCGSYLRSLPRALTQAELDYCEGQYSPSLLGWDNRLICTRQVVRN